MMGTMMQKAKCKMEDGGRIAGDVGGHARCIMHHKTDGMRRTTTTQQEENTTQFFFTQSQKIQYLTSRKSDCHLPHTNNQKMVKVMGVVWGSMKMVVSM